MEARGKLVQPSLVSLRRHGSKTKALGSSNNRHRPQMAKVPMVPTTRGDGSRGRGDATNKEHVLPATARGARGGRALRMERRGL
jgi:hypothetical protein